MAIRLSGLSSGMDTEQLVKDLMKAQRVSYDKIYKKKVQAEWKKEDYNKLYNDIKSFRENTAWNYKLQNTVVSRKVSAANESIVSATANADAANVTHSLKVTQLAEGAQKTSSTSISVDSDLVTPGMQTDKSTLAKQLGISEGVYDITVKNGSATKTFKVDTSKSVYEFVSQINNAGVNLKANYDANLDRFFIYSTNQGATAEIDFSGSSADGKNVLSALQLDPNTSATGKNAKFDLDGIVGLEKETNTFTISGITYNLKSTGTTTVSVSSDIDKAVESVKSFVNAYNELLSKINGELGEAKYRDYLPLTDEEKAELSDDQIKSYEAKARSGLFRSNTTLRSLVSSMRSAISNPISGIAGDYTSLSSIGVATGPDYEEGGKLYINEIKLRKALEEDPEILSKLFTPNGDTRSKDGIATRLYDELKTSLDKITNEAGTSASVNGDTESTLAKQVKDYEERMERMERKLATLEARYYKQFDAMEVAMNKINSQSSWLSQQLGGMS